LTGAGVEIDGTSDLLGGGPALAAGAAGPPSTAASKVQLDVLARKVDAMQTQQAEILQVRVCVCGCNASKHDWAAAMAAPQSRP